MKKVILSLLFVSSIVCNAQETSAAEGTDTNSPIRHYVGFNSGYVSGVGPTYRLDAHQFRFQATLLPIVSEDVSWLSSGMTFGFSAMNWRNDIDLYPYLGVAYFYDETKEYYYDFTTDGIFDVVDSNDRLNIGVGFSLDKNFANFFTASIRGGYAVYLATGKTPSYTLTGEVALFYRFGSI